MSAITLAEAVRKRLQAMCAEVERALAESRMDGGAAHLSGQKRGLTTALAILEDEAAQFAGEAAPPEPPGAREALREMLERFDRVDNGYCSVCGGHRLWTTKGDRLPPQPCQNAECPSHRWRAALSRSLAGGER